MKKKVLITAGGTGGHVFPAMALAKQLSRQEPGIDILFVGGGLDTNRYFEREKISFRQVECGTFQGNLINCMRGAQRILQGFYQSIRILKDYRPDIVVGFGSFYTLPTLLAAKARRLPIVLHEANHLPGKVNRLLSKYVEVTGVHFPETSMLLKGNTVEVAMPLREGYQRDLTSTDEARKYFQLAPDRLTLLVFGGSQGAEPINRLFSEAVITLPPSALQQIQVLHLTGNSAMQQQLQAKYAISGVRAHVKDYETRMNLAWQASDLMVSRAGAGTIAEQLEFEVPGILIPYPHAYNHQEKNADFMVEKVGGALKRLQHALTPAVLVQEILTLLSDGQQRLAAMRQAMKEFKLKKKVPSLCDVVLKTMSGSK